MFNAFVVGLAVLALLIGLLGKAGVEVDGRRNSWRNYYQVLGVAFGRWQKLPPVAGVTLKYFSTITRATPGTFGSLANWNNTSQKNEQLIIMLSVAGSREGIVLRAVALAELTAARAFAQETARELGVVVHEFLPAGAGKQLP